MEEVTKLVLHHDLEDLVKFQTSEIKSMFEMYSQAVKDILRCLKWNIYERR